VPEAKLTVLSNALKFIKAGEIIGCQRIKAHFLAVAKEMTSLKPNDAEDAKRVAIIKSMVNQLVGTESRARKFTDDNVKEQLNYVARRFNIEREKFEHEILDMLEDI